MPGVKEEGFPGEVGNRLAFRVSRLAFGVWRLVFRVWCFAFRACLPAGRFGVCGPWSVVRGPLPAHSETRLRRNASSAMPVLLCTFSF